MADMPLGPDGPIGFRALAVGPVEGCANALMDLDAGELLGEGDRRNGHRERRRKTTIGEITIRIPKLGEATCFPDEVLRPHFRAGRAMVGAVAEVYRLGPSTRKIARVVFCLAKGCGRGAAVPRKPATRRLAPAATPERRREQEPPPARMCTRDVRGA